MNSRVAEAPVHGPSLRRQLLQPLFWVWLLGMAVAVAGALILARAAANAAFDRGLQDEATALAAKVVWTDRGPLLDLSRQAMELITWDRADRNAFAMVDADGNVLCDEGCDTAFPNADATIAMCTITCDPDGDGAECGDLTCFGDGDGGGICLFDCIDGNACPGTSEFICNEEVNFCDPDGISE